MKAPIRFFIALSIAALVEIGFFLLSKEVMKLSKSEVRRVIKISLLRPEKSTVTIRKEAGQPVKKETLAHSPLREKPQLESRKPEERLTEKQKKEKQKPKKPGGLKPLQGNLPANYLEAVRIAIEENIFYPLEAIERGEEGIVGVKFTIDRQGRVLKCKPIKGTSEILRNATCIAIERTKFPPIPESVKNKTLSFELEIDYNLKKAFGSM